VRHLEQALKVEDVLDPDDNARRRDLLLSLGDALLLAGEPTRVVADVAPDALEIARSLGDAGGASRACQQALWGIHLAAGPAAVNTPDFQRWVEEADRWAPAGTPDRVLADCTMAVVASFTDRPQEGWVRLQAALGLAEALGDERGLLEVYQATLGRTWGPEHQQDRLRVAEQALRREASQTTLRRSDPILLFNCAKVLMGWGERQGAEQALSALKRLTERTREIRGTIGVAALDIHWLAIGGQLEEAVAAGERLTA